MSSDVFIPFADKPAASTPFTGESTSTGTPTREEPTSVSTSHPVSNPSIVSTGTSTTDQPTSISTDGDLTNDPGTHIPLDDSGPATDSGPTIHGGPTTDSEPTSDSGKLHNDTTPQSGTTGEYGVGDSTGWEHACTESKVSFSTQYCFCISWRVHHNSSSSSCAGWTDHSTASDRHHGADDKVAT